MTDSNRPPGHDGETDEGAHLTTFDPQTDSASEELLWSVSEFTGDAPEELPILSDVIDPDALDRLFQTRGGAGREDDLAIDFPYGGAHVRLSADGTVRVESTDDAPEK